MPQRPPVKIRPLEHSERPLLFNSWLETLRGGERPRPVSAKLYYARQHTLIERILARPLTTVLAAVPEDDDATVLGWLCWELSPEGPIVHYAFTKLPFQGMGVFTELVLAVGIDLGEVTFTHWTPDWKQRVFTKHPTMLYDPYRAWLDNIE